METEGKTGAWAGTVVLLLCLYWFFSVGLVEHTVYDPPWVFLDFANLIFHEAGHFIFMALDSFMHILGGSLTQLLVPLIALVVFIHQKDQIASAFCLFWLGESANNVSFYIADARTQALPLLGGDPSGHDWNWLLNNMNLLSSDTAIGGITHSIAVILMAIGLAWMVWATYVKFTQN